MAFSTDDIKHIAHLARLTLTEPEIKQYRREISGIVSYVDKLAEANVSQEEATTNLGMTNNLLRSDSITHWDETETEAALANAPRRTKRLIAVPKILES